MGLRILLLGLVALAFAREAQTVTPIEKVITLLQKLAKQISAEGKQEAADYDKYACFCKEQADNKLYAIETSEKKISELKAKETKLKADISALNGAIVDLSTKIDNLEGDIKTEKDQRAIDFEKFQTQSKDLVDAVSACERAIEAMKESKDSMGGNSKVDLAQLSASSPLIAAALLVEGKQEPAGFAYSSNEIIATLENLLAKFKQNKVELDNTEMNARSESELKVQGMGNQKKFAEKEKMEKEETSEALGESLADTTQEKEEEDKMKTADNEFMEVLTAECETKATEWDQRSQARSGELQAITTALNDPKTGLLANQKEFKVNKKLNDLQKTSKVEVAKVAPSFLQLRGSPSKTSLLAQASSTSRIAATKSVLELLMQKSQEKNSPVLASISMKLTVMQQSGIDHFVKVRTLIKDLLTKLDADAKAEANQKTYCDENIKKTVEARDAAKLTIEAKQGQLTAANAELSETKQAIAELDAGIAANMKELLEAAELREEQKVANALALQMSEDGKASIEFAMQTLKAFYDNAFLQKETYTPPKAGRDGETVGDKAPEVFSGTYHGNVDQSKGIIGVLEVIAADFQRTKEQVEKDETESIKTYEDLKTDIDADNLAKGEELKTKKAKETTLNDDIIQYTDDKKEAEKMLNGDEKSGGLLGTLDDLKKMCIEGEETYEERSQKRKDEIDALKEAMTILENWGK